MGVYRKPTTVSGIMTTSNIVCDTSSSGLINFINALSTSSATGTNYQWMTEEQIEYVKNGNRTIKNKWA